MPLEIRPFAADDVEAAGELLASRHRDHRRTEPLLAPAYESAAAAQLEVLAQWKQPEASGAIAYADGRAVGFLLGAPKPTDPWGPNVWVEAAGHAVEDAEVVRDLYAAAAGPWVEAGRTAHFALVPAHDAALLEAWSRLAFGQQHVHGIRESPTEPPAPPTGVTIRRARRTDVLALAAIDMLLPEHQGRAPVFSAGRVGTLSEGLDSWDEDFDDPAYATFVAEVDGAVVGSATGCALELSSTHKGLARPEQAGFLGFAAVTPAARGLGAGRALGEAVLGWCAEAGQSSVVTDWRMTNLLSSRTWPRLGWRPTFVRMHRLVGY